MAIVLDGTAGITTPTTGSTAEHVTSVTGFKNRIINGGMVIDQRNAGAEVNPAVTQTYYLDRWVAGSTVASKFKIGQNAGAVTPPTGYTSYLGLTSLSAYTVGAAESYQVRQLIEGLNVSDLAWGTASAATVTVSFYVRSSLTGTFGGSLRNSDGSRSNPFTYTISVANTWEQKTVTMAGDTSGTWLTTNGTGIILTFSIGTGATLSGPASAWAAANYLSATGATSVVGTNGATFYITGVQLEKGSVATSFDQRAYSQELSMCQRYYFERTLSAVGFLSSGSGQILYQSINSPVTMRVAPTSYPISGASNTNCTIATAASSTTDIRIDVSSTASGQNYSLGGVIKASAEL
jgi:hypothetical protein